MKLKAVSETGEIVDRWETLTPPNNQLFGPDDQQTAIRLVSDGYVSRIGETHK